jgi:DNA-binding NarL/FixJ family response regulator
LHLFAALEVASGLPERAARLFGAAEVVWETLGTQLFVSYRPAYEPSAASLRAGPHRDAVGRAWAEGRALSLDQVITYASQKPEAPDPIKLPGAPRASRPDGLTPREVEVLRLIASGRTNLEIAVQLVLSPRTVGRHITNIYTKIGARGRADATAYALRHGFA